MNTINYFALTPTEKEHKIDQLCIILYRFDPVLLHDCGYQEYELEALSILPRLDDCDNSAKVEVVVEEEFIYWFGREWRYNKEFTPTDFRKMCSKIWNFCHRKRS